MASWRVERDCVLLDAAPWAWRATRQAAARKAREQLEFKVCAMQSYIGTLSARVEKLESQPAAVTPTLACDQATLIDDAVATLRAGQADLEARIGNGLDVASARIDGLHSKMERMADANSAQHKQVREDMMCAFKSDLELFSGQLLSMHTALERLPGECLFKQMVDEAKSYLDKLTDDKLNCFDAKLRPEFKAFSDMNHDKTLAVAADISRVQMENVEATSDLSKRCCDIEKRIFSLEDSDLSGRITALVKHVRAHKSQLQAHDQLFSNLSPTPELDGTIQNVKQDLMSHKKSYQELHELQIELQAKLVVLEDRIVQGPTFPPAQDLLSELLMDKDSIIADLQLRIDQVNKDVDQLQQCLLPDGGLLRTSDIQKTMDCTQKVALNAINQTTSDVLGRLQAVAGRVASLEDRLP